MAITKSLTGAISEGAGAAMFRNRIINGDMRIDQRNAGAAITASTLSGYGYITDRWFFYSNITSKFQAQQNGGSATPPAGFSNYLGMTVATPYSVTSSDQFFIAQRIEGNNMMDLAWGTVNAKPVTLSFWVYSSITGNFGAAIQGYNPTSYYSYPFNYNIPVANTWTYITVTIPGPTSSPTGGWQTGNGQFCGLQFNLGCGSSFLGTANTWQSSSLTGATGATSIVGTSGATFYITGVQLEKGTAATSFEYRNYGAELALCQRYCYVWSGSGYQYFSIGMAPTTTSAICPFKMPVTMRASPTLNTTVTTANNTFGAGGPTNTTQALTAFSLNNATPETVTFGVTVASGFSSSGGQAVPLSPNGTAAKFCLEAEL